MNNLVCLASYPKSGNTWFRLFLTALFQASGDDLDINKIETDGFYANQNNFKIISEINADYLSLNEISYINGQNQLYLSKFANKPIYIKSHNSFDSIDGTNAIPEEAIKQIIYLIRNPLDVVPSLANHFGVSIDEAIDDYICKSGKIIPSTVDNLPQNYGSWNENVFSWTCCSAKKIHFVRYEDMLTNTFNVFLGAVNAMGLAYTHDQIKKAIEATTFEKLQLKEKENGFKEIRKAEKIFFNVGKAGYGKSLLSDSQIEKIISVNRPMMEKFGYL